MERLDGTEGGEKPDAGELRVGESVKLTYVDQMRSPGPRKNRLGTTFGWT